MLLKEKEKILNQEIQTKVEKVAKEKQKAEEAKAAA